MKNFVSVGLIFAAFDEHGEASAVTLLSLRLGNILQDQTPGRLTKLAKPHVEDPFCAKPCFNSKVQGGVISCFGSPFLRRRSSQNTR